MVNHDAGHFETIDDVRHAQLLAAVRAVLPEMTPHIDMVNAGGANPTAEQIEAGEVEVFATYGADITFKIGQLVVGVSEADDSEAFGDHFVEVSTWATEVSDDGTQEIVTHKRYVAYAQGGGLYEETTTPRPIAADATRPARPSLRDIIGQAVANFETEKELGTSVLNVDRFNEVIALLEQYDPSLKL